MWILPTSCRDASQHRVFGRSLLRFALWLLVNGILEYHTITLRRQRCNASNIVISCPSFTRSAATVNPAGPAPITATFLPVDGAFGGSWAPLSRSQSAKNRSSRPMLIGHPFCQRHICFDTVLPEGKLFRKQRATHSWF